MKYAAKRTWPEKPKVWELKGEAESAEAFALHFASTQDLRLGTEMVVMERDDEDAEIHFFKVSSVTPYQVVTAEARPSGGASETAARVERDIAEPTAGGEDQGAEPVALPNLRPFSSMIIYMAKVGLIATLTIAALGYLLKFLRSVI